MKKNLFIIFSFFSIFFFQITVNAEECRYSRKLNCEGLNQQDCMMAGNVASTPYVRLRAFVANKYHGLDPLEFGEKLKKTNTLFSDAWHYDEGSISDLIITFNTGSNDAHYTFSNYRNAFHLGVWDTTYKPENGIVSGNMKMSQAYSTCPDSINVTYEGAASASPKIDINGAQYMSSNDYNIFKLIDSANGNLNDEYLPIILFSDNINLKDGTQDGAQLLNAAYCNLSDTTTAFVSDGMEEVKLIVDKAANTNNPNYSIRKIYERITGFDKQQVRDTIDKLSNDEEYTSEEQRILYQYMSSLPYFRNADVQSVLIEINNDKKILENHVETYQKFEQCIVKAYGGKHLDVAIEEYMKYDPDYQGLYINAMIKLLSLFDEDNINAWLDAMSEKNYVQEKYDKYQNKIPDTTALRQKVNEEIKNDIKSINCQLLTDKVRNSDKLSPIEQVLKNTISKKCGSKDYSCYLSNCTSAKDSQELDNQINQLVNGDTEAQRKVRANINEFYKDIIEYVGVEIETDLCGIFDGALGEYITLGMSIIRIAGPILVIFLTALDGIRTMASSNEENNKKFYSKLKTRLICTILLFIVPTIINYLIENVFPNSCGNGVIK